jgi:hypothetical protein
MAISSGSSEVRRRIPKENGHFEREERSRRLAGRILGALFLATVLYASVQVFGTVMGIVVWTPLPGGFFAWWLLKGGSEHRYWLRWLVMRHDEGRHIAFDNVPLHFDILEGRIVVEAAGIFHALDATLDEAACRRLAIRYGSDGFFRGARGQWYFDEQSLMHWLDSRAERREPLGTRFHTWLGREVLPQLRREARDDG